jgi:hypothetical protein
MKIVIIVFDRREEKKKFKEMIVHVNIERFSALGHTLEETYGFG